MRYPGSLRLALSLFIACTLALPSSARTPRSGDSILQQAYLKASNAEGGYWPWPYGDRFGDAVAISGDTLVVGAIGEQSKATGVNGNQNDNSRDLAGAAYVFVREGVTWNQVAYLKASNTGAEDRFGYSVAIHGDTIVVGAPREDSESGAAYVFVRNGTSWSPQAFLKAEDAKDYDRFGGAVTVFGDTIVVGADSEDSDSTGVNGDPDSGYASDAGAAYVFVRNGTTWSQQAYLKASNTDRYDTFGCAVAMSGETLVVGADGEESDADGVNGNQSDNNADYAGAAYVFVREGTTWSQQAYLKASNSDEHDSFGCGVTIDGETAVIGAQWEKSVATGVNGDQSDNSLISAGAAYVFVRNGTSWSQQAYLKPSNTDEHDNFGLSLGLQHDWLAIGAYGEDSAATGSDGDQGDNSAEKAGAVYLFRRGGTSWSQTSYVKASNTDAEDYFGAAVTLSGSTLVVGAIGESSSATGVNGDENDDSADSSGAAYVFDLDASELLTPFCFGDPGSGVPCPCGNDNNGSVRGSGCASGIFSQGAQLSVQGYPSVGADDLVLITTRAEPFNTGLYFQGNHAVNGGDGIAFGDGLRCAGGGEVRLEIRSANGIGTAVTTVPIAATGGVAPGDVRHYQYWYRTTIDPPCGAGVNDFNLSNGYRVVWSP